MAAWIDLGAEGDWLNLDQVSRIRDSTDGTLLLWLNNDVNGGVGTGIGRGAGGGPGILAAVAARTAPHRAPRDAPRHQQPGGGAGADRLPAAHGPLGCTAPVGHPVS